MQNLCKNFVRDKYWKKYNLIQRAIIEHIKIYERHYSAQQMYA